jgi:hypothetical protein
MPRISHAVHPLRLLEDGVVECKHGAGECEGSIIELCAQELYSDPRTSLGFVECLTTEFERIPDRALYEACASKHSIDLKAIDHCATRNEGAYGFKLLRESVQRSIDVSERVCPVSLLTTTSCPCSMVYLSCIN